MEHATLHPEQYSKVASVQKMVSSGTVAVSHGDANTLAWPEYA